jgi:amino acid adenylation domain-containing protein
MTPGYPKENEAAAGAPDSGGDRALLAHDLVKSAARAHPALVAVAGSGGAELTYDKLLDRWGRMTAGLRRLGVRPEVPVAVRLDRSGDLIAAMLAVFEAGGVYAPIDPTCPPERFAAIAADLGAALLLTDREPPDGFRESGARIVSPGELLDGPPGAGEDGTQRPGPDNLAYVLSTSGSTGRPKWVAMPHRGLARLIHWQITDGPAGLATASFASLGFDVFFQETLSTLGTGGRLCLAEEDMRRDPHTFLAMLDENGVERIFLPYVALAQLALAAARLGRVPSRLRHVVTAGERLVITDAIRGFFAALPDCRLDNQYGPTETHLVTRLTLDGERQAWPELPAIGAPAGATRVYVLDSGLRQVETGELYVGGDGVARGYLKSPGPTAERFLPDPFSTMPGARMYRTGDAVRGGPDGQLQFLGRTDEQLKVHGYRVEPAEVELALSRYPGVSQAAVGVRELNSQVTALVGYLEVAESPVNAAELMAFLSRTLPGYMVPSRFIMLDALPRTPSGKVDRRQLTGLPLSDGPDPVPETMSLTGSVTAIWQRVLGHDEFTEDDDFFDVGGDSMLAAWVVTELSQVTGREVELSLLLEDSTIAGLVRQLGESAGQLTGVRPSSELITLRPGPAGRVLYLFHTLGGELFAYRDLAGKMTSPVRVLGVRWGRPPDRPLSLVELAAEHCGQIRAVQPTGPYLLAGWSFGGVLAWEVARQFREAGQEVEFLGLLDANPVLDPISGVPQSQTPYLESFTDVVTEIDRRGLAGGHVADVAEFAKGRSWTQLMGASAAAELNVAHIRRNLGTAKKALAALQQYVPSGYAGDVHLFQAGATEPGLRQRLAGELIRVVDGRVQVRDVPGDHHTMLALPHAGVLAEAIDLALDSIEKAGVQ